jgi:outer membrane protein TolC
MKKYFLISLILTISINVWSQSVYSLQDCREMAKNHNNNLKIADENVRLANNLKKAAQTQYLPGISLNGGYLHNQKNISLLESDKYLPVYSLKKDGSVDFGNSVNNSWTLINGSPAPLDAKGVPFDPTTSPEKIQWKNVAYIPKSEFEFDSKNIYSASLLLTQPLFTGGKIREINKIASSNKKIADASLEGQVSQTITETDEAYWRIVSLANKEKLAQSYIDLLKKMENDILKAIEIGSATKSDQLSVKVKLNDAQISLLQLQDGLSLSRMVLCQICGLPLNQEIKLADENANKKELQENNNSFNSTNVNQRFEIKSLEEAVKIAESNKKIMQSRFMPNAGLTAGYITSNPNIYNGFSNKFDGQFQVGVLVNVPIFHWGERIHTLKSAENEKRISEYKLQEAKEKVEMDITQAGFKLKESIKKSEMTKLNKEKAEENLNCANIGFESGVITASTLMEAQTAWLKANSEDIDANIEIALCNTYLQKALGNLK